MEHFLYMFTILINGINFMEKNMFLFNSKIELNLKAAISKDSYKKYRVIIQCRALLENTEKSIKSMKGIVLNIIPEINCISAIITKKNIETLTEHPQVTRICFDSLAILSGSSVLSANNISSKEKYALTGKNICVGVIDSGIYPHPDLLYPNNNIKKFLDLINNYKYPYDDNGHGTFISGLICSSGISSKGMYKGIAPQSSIYCIKAFNSTGRGYISDILYSIYKLICESAEFNIKVICLPFELLENNYYILSLFELLFKIAAQKNIVIVVPSGNNGNAEGSITGIAQLSNCITVGGLDTQYNILPYKYSSCGPVGKSQKPDLSAACVNICSINSDIAFLPERSGIKLYPNKLEKLYSVYTGTSCAAGFISGICALLFENNPDLTLMDICSLLRVSCNILNMSKHIQGSGILDINKLLP